MNIALYLNQIAYKLASRLNLVLYTNREWHGPMCDNKLLPTLVDEVDNQVVVDLLECDVKDVILVKVTGPGGFVYKDHVSAKQTYRNLEDTIRGLIYDANRRDKDE